MVGSGKIGRREFVGGLSVSLATLASKATFAAGWDDVVGAAKSERGSMIYAVQEPTITQALLQEFQKRFGISVEFQRYGSAVISQRFAAETEGGNHLTDLIVSGDRAFLEIARAKGWIANVGDLPSMAGLPKSIWDGGIATVAYNPQSLAFNTNLVKEAPKSWEAIVDPKWAGKVAVFDPRGSILGVQWFVLMRRAYGDAFLRAVGKQCVWASSVVPAVQQVAAGAMAMYAPAIHVSVAAIQQKGAPIDEVFLEPTPPGSIVAAIPAKAPRLATGKLLLDFIMSRAGQEIWNKDNFAPIADVPGTRKMPAFVEVSDDEALRERPAILNLLGLG